MSSTNTTIEPEVRRFRKRPVEVDAIRWTGDNVEAVTAFTGPGRFDVFGDEPCDDDPEASAAVLDSLHSSWILLYDGDWVVRGPAGECYPVRAGVFAATYEPAVTA